MSAEAVKDVCNRIRADIETVKRDVMVLAKADFAEEVGNEGEVRANAMLSFRHLEDARMRLG